MLQALTNTLYPNFFCPQDRRDALTLNVSRSIRNDSNALHLLSSLAIVAAAEHAYEHTEAGKLPLTFS